MPPPSTVTVCAQGHVLHYPSVLDTLASQAMQHIGFCAACECGIVHFVVIWAGDRTRVMESGDLDLFERFEATGWPETTHADEHGPFFYRMIANGLEISLFTRQ